MRIIAFHKLAGFVLATAVLVHTSACQTIQAPVVTWTNTTLRVMAANLTGNSQRYEAAGLRTFQGLKPDIVAIQEFNYGDNTAADFRTMMNTAFASDFVYYREAGSGYDIPNGIISRYPIRRAGSWDDTEMPNRGFAWAQIDIPGANDLYVVSVHFKASSGSDNAARRSTEAANLKTLIQAHFPPAAWIVVAGDLNTQNRSENALQILQTFLSDAPIPTDADDNPNTNGARSRPYDYVLPSDTFSTNLISAVVGTRIFPSGLVFDSRVFSPLGDVAPVQPGDSGQVQHMAVIKDFQVPCPVTNFVTVSSPQLSWISTNVIHWQGVSQLSYSVEQSTNLSVWRTAGSAYSSSTNYYYTNQPLEKVPQYYRVAFP